RGRHHPKSRPRRTISRGHHRTAPSPQLGGGDSKYKYIDSRPSPPGPANRPSESPFRKSGAPRAPSGKLADFGEAESVGPTFRHVERLDGFGRGAGCEVVDGAHREDEASALVFRVGNVGTRRAADEERVGERAAFEHGDEPFGVERARRIAAGVGRR